MAKTSGGVRIVGKYNNSASANKAEYLAKLRTGMYKSE